ncbi:unnamed protein product [Ilex paraguariensis]|uniref:Uncharacterized protein n=1 Tax=Ilex paraguariensis TaxID=185542 RepID=A0ABC8U2A0_9AQUA
MAVAAATGWFSVLTSNGTSRYSLTSQRLFATSRRPTCFFITTATNQNQNQNSKKRTPKISPSPPRKSTTEIQKEAVSQKFPERSKDERPYSNADGHSGRSKTGRSQSTAFKSFGGQRKGSKGFLLDSKEQQQVETGNIRDAAFLNAVVKLFLENVENSFSEELCDELAFMISDGKLLTNAHCVEHNTQDYCKHLSSYLVNAKESIMEGDNGDDVTYINKVDRAISGD